MTHRIRVNVRSLANTSAALSDQPKSATWMPDHWGPHGFADTIHVEDYPTHSPVLGPNGSPLQYAPKQPLGFDLRIKK